MPHGGQDGSLYEVHKILHPAGIDTRRRDRTRRGNHAERAPASL